MKTSKQTTKSHWIYAASALCLTLVLQACGGASNTADNSGDNTQIASGAVTGFGSVFVDGVEIEDATAKVVTEDADGKLSNTVLQMGQRVRVAHDGKGTASKVTVDAAVIGNVSAIDTTTNTFTVAGQKVMTVVDASAGALTVWGGGYSGLADVLANDLVEVHGTPVYDATTKAYTLTASRVQKMTGVARVQVVGVASNVDSTAKTLVLNGLSVNYANAKIRPVAASAADVKEGTVITVYGDAPTNSASGLVLTAKHLKINRLQDSTVAISKAQIGGQVSKFDSAANTFEVQGTPVTISASTTVTPKGIAVANNAYVHVTGTVGSDGVVSATKIHVREQNTSNDLAKIKLIGVISDFVDSRQFVVRGVPVDASNIDAAAVCPNTPLGNDVLVQVTATQQAETPVVLATELSCQVKTAVIIRPLDGVASSVDEKTQTFTLSLRNSNLTRVVQWTDATTWVGATQTDVATKSVRVDGYTNAGGVFIARVIMAKSSSPEKHLDDTHFRPDNTSETEGWNKYKKIKAKK